MEIFRAYDIRGIYDQELTPKMCYKIGIAFGRFIGENKVISVARDVRLSSPVLEHMFKAGILASGCDVVSLGVQPTPLLYFSIAYLILNGGCAVTASHNPPEFNGLKLCREKAFPLTYESGINKIRNHVLNDPLKSNSWEQLGKEQSCEIQPIYEEYLNKHINFEKKMHVIIDAGNGTCGFVGAILKKMGCTVDTLFAEPNGRFPHHIPNPLIEKTLVTLKKRVKKCNANLGVAFDGDGDRVGFVDNEGTIVRADKAMMIFAKDLILQHGESKILFDVATSKAVPEFIRILGGKSLMTRVGHSYIMQALHHERGEMAAEISGHYYFADDYYGFDDGIYAAMRMIEILSKCESPLSEITKQFPSYVSTPEERRACPDEKKFEVIQRVKSKFESEGYEVITIDGVRLELEDAWALVRASNTEPALVLRFEAQTPQKLEKIQRIMNKTLKESIKEV